MSDDIILEMRTMLNSARSRWQRDTNTICLQLLQDACMLRDMLGEVSYDEAVDAWERMAISAIDTLRTRRRNDEAEVIWTKDRT